MYNNNYLLKPKKLIRNKSISALAKKKKKQKTRRKEKETIPIHCLLVALIALN